MQDTSKVNAQASVTRVTIGFRYPADRIALLDAVAARRGTDRSDVLADAADALLESEFPGCLKGVA